MKLQCPHCFEHFDRETLKNLKVKDFIPESRQIAECLVCELKCPSCKRVIKVEVYVCDIEIEELK